MLVRNSDALRLEILTKLRTNYNNVVIQHSHALEDQLSIHSSHMLDSFLRGHLPPDAYSAFLLLESVQRSNPIFEYIKPLEHITLTLCDTDEPLYFGDNEVTQCSYDIKVKETWAAYLPTNISLSNLSLCAPVPKHTLYYEQISSSLLFVLTDLGFRVHINMGKLLDLQGMLPSFYDILIKVKNEHAHYINVLDYFWKLFGTLPSLNRMYKVCPSIINYVKEETKQNLFRTNPDTINPELTALKPPDDVTIALGRNKLRGN